MVDEQVWLCQDYIDDLNKKGLEDEEGITVADVPGRFLLCDAVLDALEGKRRPWATVSRREVIEIIVEYLDNFSPDVDAFLSFVIGRIQGKQRPHLLTILLKVSDDSPLPTSEIYRSRGPLGVQTVTLDRVEEPSNQLAIRVRAVITPQVKEQFASCVWNLIQETVRVSIADECLPGLQPTFNVSGDLPAVRSGRETDGAWASPADAGGEDTVAFDLGRQHLKSDDMKRFVYLMQLVWRWENAPREGCDAGYEHTIRSAVWNMAELAELGTSPVAMIGYVSVFEGCMKVLMGRDRTMRESISEVISDEMGLDLNARRRLGRLFGIRNSAIHEMGYVVRSSDVMLTWRLATASLHCLIAKVSQTERRGDEWGIFGTKEVESGNKQARGFYAAIGSYHHLPSHLSLLLKE